MASQQIRPGSETLSEADGFGSGERRFLAVFGRLLSLCWMFAFALDEGPGSSLATKGSFESLS